MAANTISQLTTANTFQHWLTATQSLIGTANLLTNGAGSTFYANTRLEVGGTNATLNVTTGATINAITGNTANIIAVQARSLNLTENVSSDLKLTNDLYVGDAISVYGDASIKGNTVISGDLVVSGNITLDAIGFDDLIVNGSGSFANTLSVTGLTTLSNVTVTGNVATLNITSNTVTQNLRVDGTSNFTGNATFVNATFVNANATGVLTVNQLVGTANTAIYAAIDAAANSAADISVALAIALG
jgi:cytoskeletal protein CcmA (bactofilin family)